MDALDLIAKIKLDSTEYEKGLSDAESSANSFGKSISSLGSSMASVASTGLSALTTGLSAVVSGIETVTSAFASGITTVAAYGDSIDKTSQKVGMSAESYQEWDYVLNLAGTSMSNCTTGIKTLTNQIDSATSGSAEATEKFEKLGISMEDLSTKSRSEIFEDVVKSMQNMGDTTERAALANDLFGRSGQEMTPLFNMTNEELEEAIDNFDKYNMALSDEGVQAAADYTDSVTTMKGAFNGLKNNLMADFLPSLTTVMNGITELIAGDSDTGIGQINEGIDNFITQLSETGSEAAEVGRKIITSLISGISGHSNDIMSAGAETIITLTEAIANALPNIVNSAGVVIEKLGSALIDKAPKLLESGQNLLEKILNGISSHTADLVNGAITIVTSLANFISNNVGLLVETGVAIIDAILTTLTSGDNLSKLLEAGLTLITSVADAILNNIDTLIGIIPELISQFSEFLADSENAEMVVEAFTKLFETLTEALPDIIEATQDVAMSVIDALVEYMTGDGWVNIQMAVAQISVLLIAAVGEIGSQIINKQVEFLSNLVSKIIGGGDDMEGAGEDLMTKLQDGFSSIIESIGPWISDKISSLVTIIKNKVTDFTNAGKSLMEGLANGIKNAASLAVTSMSGAAGLVVGAANEKFEINSPSHVFERIGNGLVEGLELGWDENIDDLNKDINKDMKYDAELNVDTNRNFNTTTITKASTLSDTDISKLAAALSVNVSNVTYLDSKEIGASTYNVVKEKTLDETKALNLATGGAYNV